MAEQVCDILAATEHAQDQYILILDAVNDKVLTYGKTSQARAQVLISGSSYAGMPGQEQEAVGNGINQAVGYLDAAALGGNVVPNIVEIGIGLRTANIRH
jgi:hypothetical protein